MANEVYANNMEVSCKAADGKSAACFPDVCFTPPQAPPTPTGVPIPYPNTGMAKDTTKGTRTVKITRKEVMLKDKSYFKTSYGDEAGCAPKKGVVTSKIKGKVYFTSWSMDVKFEGKNVVRHMDLTTHNHASEPGNTPPWIHTDQTATTVIKECETEVKKAKDMCENRGLTTRQQQCDNPQCNSAKKCLLVSNKQGERTGKKATVGCCDGEQPHHIVESHGFCEENERGTPLPQFSNTPYVVKDAPCVCAQGDRWTKEHGAFHGLVGQKENGAVRKATAPNKEYAWTYGAAKRAGVIAHRKVFPGSGCRAKCLNAQIDAYHSPLGINNQTKLRTGIQPLKDWQKESSAKIISKMKDQLGATASGGA
ncbi:PAAR-like domain-containing protein [Pseudomonas chlororaphis]|uniref:PAAR-like domain-containing protein n=1 Tax=Pseudomonas chlororaphis TaxID=587753 RepID=UPI0039DFFDB0